jgi:hypothetical protein
MADNNQEKGYLLIARGFTLNKNNGSYVKKVGNKAFTVTRDMIEKNSIDGLKKIIHELQFQK